MTGRTSGARRTGSPTAGRNRALTTAVATALFTLAAVGCAPGDSSGAGRNTISYWLWGADQKPAYQACAKAFHEENPSLRVNISQIGWDSYWTKLTASFIAGTEPDVFTNHLTRYPQFVKLGVLSPLDELGPTRGIADSDYQPGLAQAWKGPDGHRYGAPKDWDTVGIYYNRKLTERAGISDSEMATLDWNPENGGSFEKTIAHLTVDANGTRGDEPGFDKDNVVQYGLATGDAGEHHGQTQWSPFTGSTGWRYTDKKYWGERYNYDQKVFKETIDWYFGLAEQGYMAPLEVYSDTNHPETQVGSGNAALAVHGSWMLGTFADLKGVDLGIAPTPTGPTGERASMMGSLADSVTKNADNKRAAAKWVAFLSSDTCQNLVGKDAIVFPATPEGTRTAIETHRKNGIDVSPFTRHVEEGTTFSFPVTDHATDIQAIMQPVMQDIYTGEASVDSLDEANEQINFLFEQDQ